MGFLVVAVLWGAKGGHSPQKFSSPLRWPPTFLESYKIVNFEYIADCKYLRIRKMYKE